MFSSTVSLLANDTDVDGPGTDRRGGHLRHRAGRHPGTGRRRQLHLHPGANFTGTDSVDYTVTDGTLTDVGTLTITVTPVNDAPVAVDDSVTATEDTVFTSTVSLLANDTDVDGPGTDRRGGHLRHRAGRHPGAGRGRQLHLHPGANFTGTDSVDYTVTDGTLTDVGTLTITVTPVNDAPVAVDDSVTATEDTVFSSTVSLLANDTDVDGPGTTAVAGTFATAQGGTLVLAADGSYTYTPAPTSPAPTASTTPSPTAP